MVPAKGHALTRRQIPLHPLHKQVLQHLRHIPNIPIPQHQLINLPDCHHPFDGTGEKGLFGLSQFA